VTKREMREISDTLDKRISLILLIVLEKEYKKKIKSKCILKSREQLNISLFVFVKIKN